MPGSEFEPAQKFPPPFRFRLCRKLHCGGNFFALHRDSLRWTRGGIRDGGCGDIPGELGSSLAVRSGSKNFPLLRFVRMDPSATVFTNRGLKRKAGRDIIKAASWSWRTRLWREFRTRNVHPYAVCFAERVHLFQMNVMAVSLILCVRDARAAPTTDFWIVPSVTTSRAAMGAENFPAQS